MKGDDCYDDGKRIIEINTARGAFLYSFWFLFLRGAIYNIISSGSEKRSRWYGHVRTKKDFGNGVDKRSVTVVHGKERDARKLGSFKYAAAYNRREIVANGERTLVRQPRSFLFPDYALPPVR